MKVTAIRASNYLSFGFPTEGKEWAFELGDLNEHLTVIVGPNGGGKTNVLRCVKTVLEVIQAGSSAGALQPHLASLLHRPQPDPPGPMRVALDVVFDEADEREALRLMVAQALARSDFQGLVVEEDGKTRGVTPSLDPTRRELYVEWWDKQLPSEAVKELYAGTIELHFDLKRPSPLRCWYRFGAGTQVASLLLSDASETVTFGPEGVAGDSRDIGLAYVVSRHAI